MTTATATMGMMAVPRELAEARTLCPTKAQNPLKNGALLVDVREADEVARAAFGGCAVLNVPLSDIEARAADIPRDRDVILACSDGERALKAAYYLMYLGYDRVSAMKPGLARWAQRGFPIIGDAEAAIASAPAAGCCG
jgi:rhodanese-related sulfurtransferase